jgi:hypothetical protein
MATVSASTKRNPNPSGGNIGEATENIEALSCFPLDPLTEEIQRRAGLDSPEELLQTFVQGGLDIREGDILVTGGTDYPIRACGDWHWGPDSANYMYLVLEEIKS